MESGTPGVKSTTDGWLNRVLSARAQARAATPFRAVALAPQLPRTLRARRRRSRCDSSGSASAPAARRRRRVRSASTPRPPTACCSGTGRDAFDAMRCSKPRSRHATRPRTAPPTRARRSASAQADRAAGQGGRRLEVAFAESARWDHHVNEGAANGQLANRLDDFAQGIAAFVDRPRHRDAGRRHADDVRVRAGGGRERQPRHRPRPRQRDVRARRRGEGRQGLRHVAGLAGSSATKAATSR